MKWINLPGHVLGGLLNRLSHIRNCAFSPESVSEAECRYQGFVEALAYADVITDKQWGRLSGIGIRAWKLRVRLERKRRANIVSNLASQSVAEVVQDDSEQVSTPAALGQLRLLGMLDAPSVRREKQLQHTSRLVVIPSFDGIRPSRVEFPRLGKHWAPSSVLGGYHERKGHAVCRV